MNKKAIGLIAAGIIAVGASAAIGSYMTQQSMRADADIPPPAQHAATHGPAGQHYAAAQPPAQPACNDHNIVGTVAGGVAGGVLGSMIGHGTGKTVATIGGAGAGALVGNEVIPTRNVTCR
jgi:uncharacterized protein YcfJ